MRPASIGGKQQIGNRESGQSIVNGQQTTTGTLFVNLKSKFVIRYAVHLASYTVYLAANGL